MFSIYVVSFSFILVRMPGAFGRINRSNLISYDLLYITILHHEFSNLEINI